MLYFSELCSLSLFLLCLFSSIFRVPQGILKVAFTTLIISLLLILFSGTGVILTHGQCAIAVCSADFGVDLVEPGRVLSYLPLAHILGVRGVSFTSPLCISNLAG